jgi:inverted formin-2
MPARITTSPIRNSSIDVKSDVKEITSPISHGNSEEINKQSIYIHSPVVEPLQINNNTSSPKSNTHNTSVYIKPSDNPSILTNKIEIDSDNIETPPTQRKSFQGLYNQTSPKTDNNHNNGKLSNNENLGIGQFDRYSSTRRTRRFKKPLDISNISEDSNTNFSTTSPDSTSGISFPENNLSNKTLFSSPQDSTETNSSLTPTSPVKSEKCERIIERIGKIGKNISRISQEDVREAIRSLKSPSPEREWKESFRPPILSTKAMTHELNDEGFEETQSLVSDTPSLTTSSCNEEAARSKGIKSSTDVTKSNKEISAKVKSRSTLPSTSQINSLVARNQQSLERSRSLRNPSTSLASRSLTSTPKRVASMRLKPDLPLSSPSVTAGVNKRLDVERSNSIASLRSSRSSINSAVSTNTVKVMPLKKSVPFSTSSVPNVKRTTTTTTAPSTMSSTSNNVTRSTPRIPASRSSSSGSSVGQNVSKKPPIFSPTKRITPTPVTTSRNPQISSRVRLTQNLSVGTNNNNSQRTSSSSGSSFMRPTTSSATKVKSK